QRCAPEKRCRIRDAATASSRDEYAIRWREQRTGTRTPFRDYFAIARTHRTGRDSCGRAHLGSGWSRRRRSGLLPCRHTDGSSGLPRRCVENLSSSAVGKWYLRCIETLRNLNSGSTISPALARVPAARAFSFKDSRTNAGHARSNPRYWMDALLGRGCCVDEVKFTAGAINYGSIGDFMSALAESFRAWRRFWFAQVKLEGRLVHIDALIVAELCDCLCICLHILRHSELRAWARHAEFGNCEP